MQRSILLQRGKIDLETGRFPLTLFTNGEASDGHIVDISGLQVDANTPMFINHNPDPVQRMGRLENPRKVGKKTQLGGGKMAFDGVIDVAGDGAMGDIRRDIAHGISVGDITAMSGRWDPISATPRAALAKTHYAYSDIEGGWETPMFFESARVLEGSIVGVPADAAAMIGRSRDLSKPEHVRAFYDVLVNGDPISQEAALVSLCADASKIEGLQEIETTTHGRIFVPAEVAGVWVQSGEEIEREEIALTGESATPERSEAESEFIENADRRRDSALDEIESTESEPVSAPESETTETDEPVSEPSVPATERAAVALPTFPELEVRPEVIDKRIRKWLAAEMGFIQ